MKIYVYLYIFIYIFICMYKGLCAGLDTLGSFAHIVGSFANYTALCVDIGGISGYRM